MKSTFTNYTFLALFFLLLGGAGFSQSPGNALNFDAANDLVNCPLPTVFDSIANKDITVEAWINPAATGFRRVMYAQSSTTNFFNFATSNTLQIYFYVVAGGSSFSVATTNTLAVNQWTHVACRWTASTQAVEVFFNGVLQAGSGGGGSSTGSNGIMTIGSRPGGAQYFGGGIDEMRIWREARSDCNIAANYNATFPNGAPNLVAYYQYNQGVAGGSNGMVTGLPDLSGNGWNGTLSGFTLSGATSNWIASTAGISISGPNTGGFNAVDSTAVCAGTVYTFPDSSSQTIDSTTVQVSTLTSAGNCDSIITTTVNLLPSYNILDSVAACPGTSLTFPDGSSQTIDSAIVQVSTFSTANSCDSIITTAVSLLPTYNVMDTAQVCAGSMYTFPDGSSQVIDSAFVQTSSLVSSNGCDSTVVTNVSAISVDDSVSLIGMDLTSTAVNATFQWLNCDNNLAAIPSATASSFTPTANGNYAVAVTQNGCTDTSACTFVNTVGIDNPNPLQLLVYPNPAQNEIRVSSKWALEGNLQLINLQGKLLKRQSMEGEVSVVDLTGLAKGFYFLRVESDGSSQTIRFVKE